MISLFACRIVSRMSMLVCVMCSRRQRQREGQGNTDGAQMTAISMLMRRRNWCSEPIDSRHSNLRLKLNQSTSYPLPPPLSPPPANPPTRQKNLFYASLRFRARVHGAPGAVAGLFLFRNDQNESDIEILTRDLPAEIRFSNQPVVDKIGNEITGASTSVNLDTGAKLDGSEDPDVLRRRSTDVRWDGWHTYRLDWVRGRNTWFVDGKHYLDKKYGVPTVPSYLVMVYYTPPPPSPPPPQRYERELWLTGCRICGRMEACGLGI